MTGSSNLVALPGLVVLAAGPVTSLWIFYFKRKGRLPGPLPRIVAWFVLAEALAGGFNNGLVHVLSSRQDVYWTTVAGFAAAFSSCPHTCS